jgi:hypothetical protein
MMARKLTDVMKALPKERQARILNRAMALAAQLPNRPPMVINHLGLDK